jgi:hypothetical protein
MTKGLFGMEMPEQIKTKHYSNLEKLLHKQLTERINMQTLKEIYGTAKNKNKLYQKRSFADFIQDFGNCGDEFFDSVNQYHKWIMKKENYQSWYGFYKKYYSTNN